MKLIDTFNLGFVLRKYNDDIVVSGLTRATEETIDIVVHKGFNGTSDPIRERISLPIDVEFNSKTMDLIMYLNYSEDLANSLKLVGVAPITAENIRKTRFKQ